jgi:hypothetical protein
MFAAIDWARKRVARYQPLMDLRAQGKTFAEIAEIYGCTVQNIAQKVSAYEKARTYLRPSKIASLERSTTGYRRDSERHRQARAKVSAERRKEIARMGGAARHKVE